MNLNNYSHLHWVHTKGPCQQSVKEGAVAHRTLPFTYKLLTVNISWEDRVTVFRHVPSAELSRLQGTTPNPSSHRWFWLISVGHIMKSRDRTVKERFVERRNRGHRDGGWALVNMYFICM